MVKRTGLGRNSIREIDEKMVHLRESLPCEFQRRPRPITEFERWKATEVCQLLPYTGPLTLFRILETDVYKNFMLLSVAVNILLNPDLCHQQLEFSHKLLLLFVEYFGQLYGIDKILYNVHGLVMNYESGTNISVGNDVVHILVLLSRLFLFFVSVYIYIKLSFLLLFF